MIQRTLWYRQNDREVELSQAELQNRPESLVILGEAGMGKTFLLDWLALLPNHARCTARQLITRSDPTSLLGTASVLVVDALDEVSAQKDGDAVDLVLHQLGKLGYPRFVLSCRVADWRSATGVEAIREHYASEPLELHLRPFTDEDAADYLGVQLRSARAQEVITHFVERGLGELLGNPQTLNLIARVAQSGSLPATRSQLFERAVDVLRVEHRDAKADQQLPQEAALRAAGAAFAGLILTGNEAITRKAVANLSEGELALVELSQLPHGDDVPLVLGTRLFRSDGADRFGYLHRRVGEFLGARYLASVARTKRLRRRLLSMFHRHGLVPASLRGVHAWLAREPALAEAVISADPMGLIEYGDADDLTVDQARWLIKSLERLAAANPRFRGWGPYSVRGIARHELLDELRRLVVNGSTPIGLRLLVLQAIKGSSVARTLIGELRALVLDGGGAFASRNAAGEALVGMIDAAEWPLLVESLIALGDELSVRLAIELIDEAGYGCFDDGQIARAVVANAEAESRTVGTLLRVGLNLPDERLKGILDRLADSFPDLTKLDERVAAHELADFVYRLVVRRMKGEGVSASELWSWLKVLNSSFGYHNESKEQIAESLKSDASLRRDLLQLVLLDEPGEELPWQRYWPLNRSVPGLVITAGDVINLLEAFEPQEVGSARWRDVVQLVRHNGEDGYDVRLAASARAGHDVELKDWIDSLATPPVPEWKIEDEKHKERRREEDARRRGQARAYFLENIQRLRAGEFALLIKPAKAYLKLFSDVGTGSNLPAHERVEDWLGQDVWLAARDGFEQFLKIDPPEPSPEDILTSFLNGKHREAGYILVAALAERLRSGKGFDDLSNERLLAAVLELFVSPIASHAGLDVLEKELEAAVRARGIWADAIRTFIEPQLERKRERVDGLWSLMHSAADADVSAELAASWLRRFPDLPSGPERELIDRLFRAGHFQDLRIAASLRGYLGDCERKRCWDAVGLIIDFEATAKRLSSESIDPHLLWPLREFTSGRRDDEPGASIGPAQIEWIVANFRASWPRTGYPSEGFSGSENSWDASEFLHRLINRLGADTSDEAANALERLRQISDGYSEHLHAIAAENAQLRVEASYIPPTLSSIAAVANDRPPVSIGDLQATMVEELAVVQKKVAADDVESWRGFISDSGEPYGEERCRDHLLGLLRQGSEGVVLDPEAHVAGDKEVDITCSVGPIRMPIEIKGQWHPDLWHAADTQLDRLYSTDWRAEKRGIYLVLWFGENTPRNKALRSPGLGLPLPRTPAELCAALIERSKAAKEGRVQVVVLDLARGVAP